MILANCIYITCFSQTTPNRKIFFQPEYSFGKILPNYKDTFPSTTFQQGLGVKIGSVNIDTTGWAKYYNFAEAGIFINYFSFGNEKVFGHQFSASPYIAFPVFNQAKGNYHFKLGLGLAYFTKHFDSINNTSNQMVGSPFTWDFKLFLYRNIYSSSNFNLLVGGGFSHESNGHTRMPNMGINSFLIILSGQFFANNNPYFLPPRIKGKNHAEKKMFIFVREGYGFHEQSVSEGPKTGEIKPVYASSFALGYTYNNHLKLRTGFTYKFYEQYRNHLATNNVTRLSNHPNINASAVVFYVGNEFLMSHVGMDMEMGVNLFKPFYWDFNKGNKIATTLMKVVATRLGLNLYLFDTNKLPPHNFFIGANINANLAKADFTEFNIGYTYNFE